jgi:hypothetical protein
MQVVWFKINEFDLKPDTDTDTDTETKRNLLQFEREEKRESMTTSWQSAIGVEKFSMTASVLPKLCNYYSSNLTGIWEKRRR